jgi:GNAT superfamily N-acetyltransferase
MRDLTDPRWIRLKAALFVLLGVAAGALLLARTPSLEAALLLAVTVWAFCRAYYFAFYVIGKYVDPRFRFSGLGSALRHLLRRAPAVGEERRQRGRAAGPPS